MRVGETIKKLRKKKNWSQTELAEKIGSHLSHIHRLETGQYCPSLAVLMKLADVFDVSLDTLVKGDESRNLEEVRVENKSLAQRLRLMETLDGEDQKALIRVIDSMLTKKKIAQFINQNQEVEVEV